MPSDEYAALLVRKAAQDEFTVEKLVPDPKSPDEVIGFHAQQAVEKLLKAVLMHSSIQYRRTHDLVELLDLLRENGLSYPPELEEVRRLTPFAAAFRYDELPDESEEPFDRLWAQDCVRKTRSWAESVLHQAM
jgi:HEPN domain-containing protein